MATSVLAHWHTRIDTFQFSTQEFYERLSDSLGKRQMPDVKLSRINLPEGSFLQAYRDYLYVNRGKFSFNLCAAPFGVDFFVSWWLTESPGCLSGCLTAFIPFLGIFARKQTFYEEDTAIMFRESVHASVLQVMRDILGDKSITVDNFPAPTVARSPLA